MAHKGYTLNYFIDYFSSIPSRRWTEGELLSADGAKACALGLAGNAERNPDNFAGVSTTDISELPAEGRAAALEEFLGHSTAEINDGAPAYKSLGKTPRARVLRALRNRKRTGAVLTE
ncbi:unnamed protein product [Sphagnum balticum]